MNRREAIQKATLALGFAISAPALTGILNGCKSAPEINYQPIFFTREQAGLIAELSEILLPKTDTPGAKEVGVPSFIDTMLKEVYPKEEQDSFLMAMTDFDVDARTMFNDAFIDCTPEQQKELVKKHHDAAFAGNVGGASGNWWDAANKAERPFILRVKELVLLGFFTSEAGATQVLQYNEVPGPYHGCVPLAEVGKAWAT